MVEDVIEQNRAATAALSKLVQDDLTGFFGALDLSKPEIARDALIEFMPLLVSEYGSVTETLALDYYDDMRAAQGAAGTFRASAGAGGIPVGAVESKVRYLAGNLWTAAPESMLGGLLLAADKYVKQPGRDAIADNAKREGVGYARVPQGRTTCSFCLMLASRDAIYASKRSAGDLGRGKGDAFHGFCDCSVIRIAKASDYPEGYLPDDYYDTYRASRDIAKSDDPAVREFLAGLDPYDKNKDLKATAFAMRREFPHLVKDGIGRSATKTAAKVATESAKPAVAAAMSGQALADTVTYHSTLHMSDGDLADMMSKHADDPVVFDKIMDVMDERDAKYMTVQTKATGAKVASLDDKPPAPVKLDPSPVTNPAARKQRNLTQAEVASEEYQNYAMAQYSRALDDLNGVLLNTAGKAKARAGGITDLEMNIFSGSAVTARKYASEELLSWWEEQGRETLGSFRYKMYGWNTDRKAAQTVRNMGYERGQAFRDRSTF